MIFFTSEQKWIPLLVPVTTCCAVCRLSRCKNNTNPVLNSETRLPSLALSHSLRPNQTLLRTWTLTRGLVQQSSHTMPFVTSQRAPSRRGDKFRFASQIAAGETCFCTWQEGSGESLHNWRNVCLLSHLRFGSQGWGSGGVTTSLKLHQLFSFLSPVWP